jgi:hypothetical protein
MAALEQFPVRAAGQGGPDAQHDLAWSRPGRSDVSALEAADGSLNESLHKNL